MADNIQDLKVEEFGNLFPEVISGEPQPADTTSAQMGLSEDVNQDLDLFNMDLSTTETTTVDETSVTETTTEASTGETTTKAPEEGDTDILSDDTKKAGRKPKYNFDDATGYFADRIKSGKFVALTEEVDGKEQEFIPKTPEEFDEFIDTQVSYQLEQKIKEGEQAWYQSKSPAWKAVAKYAELVDDPAEMVPFIGGIQTINTVANLNEEEADGAEEIIRVRLEQRGEPQDVIDDQIESLKASDKLISTAKKYKPLILQEEQTQLQSMAAEKQRQEANYVQMVTSIRENAIKAIEAPMFGKHKLKQEEKAVVYDLIAEPEPSQGGYGIYSKIDELFSKGDFETLKQVALLLGKKESFFSYMGSDIANRTAAGLEKKIRVATDSRQVGGGSSGSEGDSDRPSVRRNQYNTTARFGR